MTAAAPGRRRRRWPIYLAVALVVLIVLLVIADRVALGIAERKAGETLQTSQGLQQRPSVSVAGFPFLTQLAAGDFDHVTITAHDVPIGNSTRTLAVDTLRVDLRQVTVPHDFSWVRAATASADARIAYPALSDALGATIDYGGNGQVGVGGSVAGRSLHATVRPVVSAGRRLTLAGLNGILPGIELQGLPFGVTVDGVSAEPDGLHVRLSGRNLVYRS